MAPGNIFGRIMQYLANEIIVKGLANNPSFQRFAVRSATQMRELTKTASETAKELTSSSTVSRFAQESRQLRNQIREFASALRDEMFRGPPPRKG